MRHIRIATVIVLALQLIACSKIHRAPIAERNITDIPVTHTVRKGETLYYISWTYGLDYKQLASWNGIGRPYYIYPGQKLILKPRAVKTRKSRRATQPASRQQTPQRKTATKTVTPKAGDDRDDVYATVKRWIWPTQGKVVRTFSARGSGKKGIEIAGKAGQRIIATAPGKVVYSGTGLLGYGKLIIIKHNNTYLSAYAHNRRLLVKENQTVKQGQKIAEMGSSGTNKTVLHFEIRRNGKPVNPMRYLKQK